MKCEKCDKEAVTFHGVSTVSHGYCEDHRCCAKCGLQIHTTGVTGHTCTCKVPTEREDYLQWKRAHRAPMTSPVEANYRYRGKVETLAYERGSRMYKDIQEALTAPGPFRIWFHLTMRQYCKMGQDARYHFGINAATMSENIRRVGDVS